MTMIYEMRFPRYPESTDNNEAFKVTYYRKTLMKAIWDYAGNDWCDARNLQLVLGLHTAKNHETFEFCVRAGVLEQDPNLDYLFRITQFGNKWMQQKKNNGQWDRVRG
ncbi:MAG: hypothetical protein H7175_01245 [Burkholderiales bacterium]|nr:hypothetical protein [Anaerolineae bacterium]